VAPTILTAQVYAPGRHCKQNAHPFSMTLLPTRTSIIKWLWCLVLLAGGQAALAQPMSGNYSLGGVNPDFPTFAAALQRLDSFGVTGPVTIWVRNGTYGETLLIDSVNGASAVNTITFRSESSDSTSVIINGTTTSTNTNTLWMNRVAYMRFHQLTFRQLPSVHNNAVVFVGRGHNLTFSNCVLWGHVSSTSSGTEYVVQGGCDSNLVVENCIVRGANEGITASGSSFSLLQKPIFRNNHIFGISTNCIYVVGGAFAEISNNLIEAGGGSSTAGILLSGHSRARIVGNRIAVLSGAQNSHGIQIISSSGWANQPILIANNEISFTAGNSPIAYGIRASGSYHLYAHNSVRMSGGVYSVALQLEVTNNCRLFNNVLVHEGTATANHALHLSINSQDAVSNYNNLYAAGPNLTPIHTTLAAYQTATGRDSLSVSVPPQFTSTSILIPNAPALMNSGLLLPEVPTDINGRVRNNPPDMGAYEQLTAPVVQLGPDTTACDSLLLTVQAQPGTQWLWSTGDTVRSLVIRTSGTYWLQGTNSVGVSRDTVVVTILPRPVLQLGFTSDSLCAGDCVVLQSSISGGSGNFSYQWSPSVGLNNPNLANPLACPAVSTTYRLQVTDANGCAVLSDSIRIYITPAAQLLANTVPPACAGDTVVLQASAAWNAATYRWEPAGLVENPNQAQTRAWPPSGNTLFSVVAMHPDGCRDTALVNVLILPLPPQPTITRQGSLLLSSASSGNQWYRNDSLLPGATGPGLSVFENGRYRVVVTDSNGCSSSSGDFVVQNVGIQSLSDAIWQVWPNPGGDWLAMHLPKDAVYLKLYDIHGRLQQSMELTQQTTLEMNTTTLSPGSYLLELHLRQGYSLHRHWVKR